MGARCLGQFGVGAGLSRDIHDRYRRGMRNRGVNPLLQFWFSGRCLGLFGCLDARWGAEGSVRPIVEGAVFVDFAGEYVGG